MVVLASMNLMECQRMAIPGDPMCGMMSIYGSPCQYEFDGMS